MFFVKTNKTINMKTELYLILADVVAVTHGIVVVYLLSFSFLFSKKREVSTWYILPAIPISIIATTFMLLGQNCPLVTLERKLRVLAGQNDIFTNKGFIETYLHKFMGLSIPSGLVELALGIIMGIILFGYVDKLFQKRIQKK